MPLPTRTRRWDSGRPDRVGRLVGDLQQARRLGRPPGHAQQPAQPLVADPLLVPDLDRHRVDILERRAARWAKRAGVRELAGSLIRSPRERNRLAATRAPSNALNDCGLVLWPAGADRQLVEPAPDRPGCGTARSDRRRPRRRGPPPRPTPRAAAPPPSEGGDKPVPPRPAARSKAALAPRSDSTPGSPANRARSPMPTSTKSVPPFVATRISPSAPLKPRRGPLGVQRVGKAGKLPSQLVNRNRVVRAVLVRVDRDADCGELIGRDLPGETGEPHARPEPSSSEVPSSDSAARSAEEQASVAARQGRAGVRSLRSSGRAPRGDRTSD